MGLASALGVAVAPLVPSMLTRVFDVQFVRFPLSKPSAKITPAVVTVLDASLWALGLSATSTASTV